MLTKLPTIQNRPLRGVKIPYEGPEVPPIRQRRAKYNYLVMAIDIGIATLSFALGITLILMGY